jgi:surfeit locus 1 family protein
VNTASNRSLADWLPFLAGGLLVLQFLGLCVWQVSRGMEKLATRDAFAAAATYTHFHDGAELRPYEALKATGHYDPAHQVLLDNITLESRYGYYVITPFVLADDEPVLLVNRGWIEKAGMQPDLAALAARLDVPATRVTVHGHVGGLPRAGMRMGEPFAAATAWPRVAVFPRLDETALALGRDVQPFVLLLDPEDEHGFLRQWGPEEMSAGRHFGYALQWFAMAAVLGGLLAWHARRRRPSR